MDKFKILIILIIVFIFAEGAGLIYFANKSQQIKKARPKIEEISAEKQELERRYEEVSLKYKVVERDRNNLLIQTKRLIAEKNKSEESGAALEKLETMKKLFETEKLEMEKREIGLQADLDRLKGKLLAVRGTVDKEKAALDEKKSALEIEQAKNVKEDYERKISKLNKKNKIRFAAVEKDYRKLESELKKSNRALRKRERTLAKAEKRIAGLRLANDEYRSKYIDAEKKNKALAREARNLPRKFSEMARLNKQLIKETAKMHYNLGVFYTNSKEYKRAITEFVKATEINPKDAHTHFNLGYIYGEYLADRNKAMRHFRHYLRYAERNDKDIDWVKKYLLTWETFEGTKTGAIR